MVYYIIPVKFYNLKYCNLTQSHMIRIQNLYTVSFTKKCLICLPDEKFLKAGIMRAEK